MAFRCPGGHRIDGKWGQEVDYCPECRVEVLEKLAQKMHKVLRLCNDALHEKEVEAHYTSLLFKTDDILEKADELLPCEDCGLMVCECSDMYEAKYRR